MERMYEAAAQQRAEQKARSTNIEDQRDVILQNKVARHFQAAFKSNPALIAELFGTYVKGDGDGAITYDQLRDGLREADVTFTDEGFDRIIRLWDADLSGKIDYFEFAACFKNSQMTLEASLDVSLQASTNDNIDALAPEPFISSAFRGSSLKYQSLAEAGTGKGTTPGAPELIGTAGKKISMEEEVLGRVFTPQDSASASASMQQAREIFRRSSRIASELKHMRSSVQGIRRKMSINPVANSFEPNR